MSQNSPTSCPGENPGRPLSDLGYRFEEQAVLTLSRYYFASFAAPQSQGWLGAVRTSKELFGSKAGPNVAVGVLEAVQAMRSTRQSCFVFNSPQCPCCANYVTSHEQSFMSTLRALARRNHEAATAHANLLCEFGDVSDFLSALCALLCILQPDKSDIWRQTELEMEELHALR